VTRPAEADLAPLPRAFFDRQTVTVARELLGMTLVRQRGSDLAVGRIVETEAYVGTDDRACHASRGRTQRTEVMFGPPGIAYVYLIYGMYHCLNVVTEAVDFPAAVLVRAVEPLHGIAERTDGPGRLCRALAIDRALNGHPLDRLPLWIAAGPRPSEPIVATPRVGVAYAGEWALRPWRFILANDHQS
jgi:DNA-3-methyladenine glycosylase